MSFARSLGYASLCAAAALAMLTIPTERTHGGSATWTGAQSNQWRADENWEPATGFPHD